MITHWLFLSAGLALGLVPPRLLINCECRYLTFEDFWFRVSRSKEQGRRRRWWKMPLVWIDPVRGYVVAWFLSGAFTPAENAAFAERLMPMILSCALMLLCLWAQTKGRPGEQESLSPTGFVAGMMLALLPPAVAVATLVMGAATVLALHSFAAGYFAATLTLMGVGFAMMGKSVTLATATAVMAFPVFIGWMRRARLVMPVRS